MPSIATDSDVREHEYVYKLDTHLIEMLILHGKEWFDWMLIGGSSRWYWDAVKHGYLKVHPDKASLFCLTDKAMAYLEQLGEEHAEHSNK